MRLKIFQNYSDHHHYKSCQNPTFLETLINQGNHHAVPATNLARLVESFAQDIASAVTLGKYMQRKHFLLRSMPT